MPNLNKVMLIGHLGADPELRYTANGTAVANMRLATTKKWKNRDGEQQEQTEWHTVVAWDKLGELCGEHLSKGRAVYFEGELQTRKWEDRDGNTRYSTEIRAYQMQFLGGGNGSSSAPSSSNQAKAAPANSFDPDDDLPF